MTKLLKLQEGGLSDAITKGKTPSKLTKTLTNVSPWISVGSSVIGGFLPQKTEYAGAKGAVTAGIDQVYDSASDAMMQINPAIGGLMKGAGFLSKGINALGGGTDGMTTSDAILSSNLLQWTPLGMINGFGGSKTDTMQADTETQATVGSSYGGFYNSLNNAMSKQGKKYGLFSQGAKDSANQDIWRAGRLQNALGNLTSNRIKMNNVLNNQLDQMSQQYANSMGGNLYNLTAARKGMKLFSNEQLERVKGLSQKKQGGVFKFDTSAFSTPIEEPNVEAFKKGGQMNVIPEGALHARKHTMFEDSPELKGQITTKGIPVVTEKEGGEIEQQAEIEANEIIFNKEVTTKLEEYYKRYEETNDDSYAIKAGKLLAKEIMENTDDRTGLIEETT